ncbi:MAG: hypothetical protein ABIF71_14485 [Planctomycetota bacterium]
MDDMGNSTDTAGKRNPDIWVPTLYYTQGYPLTFVMRMGNIFFTYMGVPIEALGVLFGIFNLPWVLKFLWSPLVDFVGTKRRWILVMQGALAVMCMAVAAITVFMPADLRADGVRMLALRFPAPSMDGLWLALNTLMLLLLIFGIGLGIDRNRGGAVRLACLALCVGVAAFFGVFHGRLIASVAFPLPVHIWMIAGCFLVTAFLSATHDVAIDGYYLDVLDKDGQAKFSGVRVAAYRVAMVVGGGLLVMLAAPAGWGVSFGLGAAIFLGFFVFHALYLPAGSAAVKPAGPVAGRSIVQAFTTYLDQKRIVVILPFILLYRIDDFLWSPMSVPFLKSIGVTQTQVATINGIIGAVAAIIGGILGGVYISRKGLRKGLWVLGLIQGATLLLYVYLAWVHPALPEGTVIGSGGLVHVALINAFENMAYGLGAVAFVNFLMRTCKKDYSAVHYAIATGITALAMTCASFISGFLVKEIGFLHFFMLCFACSIPGLVLLRFLPLEDMEAAK